MGRFADHRALIGQNGVYRPIFVQLLPGRKGTPADRGETAKVRGIHASRPFADEVSSMHRQTYVTAGHPCDRLCRPYAGMMADLSQIFFRITLDSIVSAYREGREALATRIQAADDAATEHAAKLDAGETVDDMIDEETGQSFSQTEYLYYQSETRREMLNHHAQAFAIMIHHAWEKHVLNLNPEWEEYRCNQAYGELIKQGFSVDKPRLERLRLVSNFVKHESLDILDRHPEMFAEEVVIAYNRAKEQKERYVFEDDVLKLSDDDISDFIDATYQSAGRPEAKQRVF